MRLIISVLLVLLSTPAAAEEPEELTASSSDLFDALLEDGSAVGRFDRFRRAVRTLEKAGGDLEPVRRLERAVLVMAWSGGLSEPATVDRFVDAANEAWPDIRPHRLIRDVLGRDRADPVIDAIRYRPERGESFRPEPPSGMGTLAFYRAHSAIGLLSVESAVTPLLVGVERDGVALLDEGTYAWTFLPPGTYTVTVAYASTHRDKFVHTVKVREGKTRWVRVVSWRKVLGPDEGKPVGEADFSGWAANGSLFRTSEDAADVRRSSRGWKPLQAFWMDKDWRAPVVSAVVAPRAAPRDTPSTEQP